MNSQCVCVFTQIDHQQASQCRVEGGPTSHVAQIGLVVHSQEGEVLALMNRRDVNNGTFLIKNSVFTTCTCMCVRIM